MRHTLTDSNLQGSLVETMCVPGRSYLYHLCPGEALHRHDHKQTGGWVVTMPKALGPAKGGTAAGLPAGANSGGLARVPHHASTVLCV